ncbi:MAG: heme-binding protein [Pseudomonadota bacterium]
MNVSLEQARAIVRGAMAAGREHAMMPLTVAVLDAGGHLVALEREDGSGIMRVEIATGKAWGALGMGQPSRVLRDRLTDRPHFIAALTAVSGGRFVPVPGGILLEQDKQVIGAVGVSGDTSEKDEFCAIAGAGAAGLASRPEAPDPGWQGSKL